MASEIEGCELDVANGELLGGCIALNGEVAGQVDGLTRVKSCLMSVESAKGRGTQHTGLQDRYTVVLEHVQESGLSGIVETEKQQLCVLIGQAERGKKVEDWEGTSASCANGVTAPLMGYVELEVTYTCRY